MEVRWPIRDGQIHNLYYDLYNPHCHTLLLSPTERGDSNVKLYL